jgi:hypothetical protein
LTLYHASLHPLTTGQRLPANARAASDPTEQALEAVCPQGSHSRLNSFFAFDRSLAAWRYLLAQTGFNPSQAKLYRVEMPDPEKHPMALVDAVKKRGDHASISLIIAEYWSPTQNWKYCEYLCPSMTVVAEEDTPSTMISGAAISLLMEDHELIRRLWPMP